MLGVILLIVAVFRSLRPLLLCLISIGIGALAGTVVTLLIFGELHLMTLVMSMSIIGISADYTLYYLTERMVHGAETSPWQSLAKVRNALLGAIHHRSGLSDYDAGPLPRYSPDGGIRGGRSERLLPDGHFLAPVVVSSVAGTPGAGNGTHATLACCMATQ